MVPITCISFCSQKRRNNYNGLKLRKLLPPVMLMLENRVILPGKLSTQFLKYIYLHNNILILFILALINDMLLYDNSIWIILYFWVRCADVPRAEMFAVVVHYWTSECLVLRPVWVCFPVRLPKSTDWS